MITALALLVQTAAPSPCRIELTLPREHEVHLATVDELSSKHNAKGDMIALVVTDDVHLDGRVVIPKGTPATGQIADSQERGGVGVGGKLLLRPLYLRAGGTVVRLSGASERKGGTSAGTVMAISVLNGGLLFSGKTAKIPAGSRLDAFVERSTTLGVEGEGACPPAPK